MPEIAWSPLGGEGYNLPKIEEKGEMVDGCMNN